ncbi:MAG: DUF1565 domain-containing protein [Ardenticatenales bacterium]|nr:DUF1565 domain-containing protein [Ardenticatenales bacterium]
MHDDHTDHANPTVAAASPAITAPDVVHRLVAQFAERQLRIHFLTLLTLLVAFAVVVAPRPAPIPTAHAEAPPHRLNLPIVHVNPPPPRARTLDVPSEYATIAAAFAAARPGDTVRLAEGTYAEKGLRLPDGVTLRGAGWRRSSIVSASPYPAPAVGGRSWRASLAGVTLVLAAVENFVLAAGEKTTIEGVRIWSENPFEVGILVDGPGRHTIRDVMLFQLANGLVGTCTTGPECIAQIDIRRSIVNCDIGINTDANTHLVADHLTVSAGTGARIRRPQSRLTNSLFEGADVGIDNGPLDIGSAGIDAHHNLFSETKRPYATWIPAVDGDLSVDALRAPMDWWLTPLSPARHAASDGTDIGALPFAGIGAPPTNLRTGRAAAASLGAAQPWVVSWDPVPDAWMYHVVASPADGGPPSLRYSYARATGHDDGPMKVMDWLDPGRAYWVAVSTAYFERGESAASEAVMLPAGAGE